MLVTRKMQHERRFHRCHFSHLTRSWHATWLPFRKRFDLWIKATPNASMPQFKKYENSQQAMPCGLPLRQKSCKRWWGFSDTNASVVLSFTSNWRLSQIKDQSSSILRESEM